MPVEVTPAELAAAAEALRTAIDVLQRVQSTLAQSPRDATQSPHRGALDEQPCAATGSPTALADSAQSDAQSHARSAAAGSTTALAGPDSHAISASDLQRWLATRGASLRSFRCPLAADEPLDGVAVQIGERFTLVEPLLAAARKAASMGRARTVYLRDLPSDATGAITGLGQRLHDLGLLSFARYDRASSQLQLRVADAGVEFLGGGWLERWVAQRAARALAGRTSRGLVLRGVEITLVDGQAAEVDAVVLIDGRDPLIVESRAGAYQDRLDRDVRLRRSLRLAPEDVLIVLGGAGDTACAELSAIHGLHVTTLDALDDAFAIALGAIPVRPASPAPMPAPPQAGALVARPALSTLAGAGVLARDVDAVRTMLRRSGMRPHPGSRRAILEAVAAVVSELPQPASTVKLTVAERTQNSRSAIQDVLTALARGGALLGQDGSPVAGLGDVICDLVSRSVDELDLCCQRAWRAGLLAQDPTMLSTAAGERSFALAVGGLA